MGYDTNNPELMRKLKAQEVPKAPAEITKKTKVLAPPPKTEAPKSTKKSKKEK